MGVATIRAAFFSRFSKPGTSPADPDSRPRTLEFSQNPISVSPRVVAPENGDPSSMSYVEHYFANSGSLELGADANKFTLFDGDESVNPIGFDGLYVKQCQLRGGGFRVSPGNYLEEGVIRLDNPFSRIILGQHDPATPAFLTRGILDIFNDGGVGKLRIGQVDDTGAYALNTMDVEFPIGYPTTPGSTQEYAYYHFYRRFDQIAGFHRTRLTVNTTAAPEVTQTFGPGFVEETGVDKWSDLAQLDQNAFVLWLRCAWNDTFSDVDIGNSPWSNPRVFETTVFQAHGDYPDGWIDGGEAELYWRDLRFTQLVLIAGSKLEVRAVALDTVPNASLDGLWDSSLWIDCVPGRDVNLYNSILGYPRGRYLLLQLRFTPSSTISLNGSTALFYGSGTGGVAIAADNSLAVPSLPGTFDRVAYAIRNSEGQALLEIPVAPDFPFNATHQGGVSRFELEDGRVRTHSTVTRSRMTNVPLRFPVLTTAQKEQLEEFFEATAVEEPFTFTDPDGVQHSVAWSGGALDFSPTGPDRWSMGEITVTEVF